MYESCLAKQNELKKLFVHCKTKEERYQQIIQLGKELPSLPDPYKTEENRVRGCQSQMYLYTNSSEGKIVFQGSSDALISQGLAALLIRIYSGESPETILKCPPNFLEELGIPASLSPNRANGLYSLHLRMKQEALKRLVAQ